MKESVFTLKLEPDLRDAFMDAAAAAHRPASQVVRELMREFVVRQSEANAYDAFVQRKVDLARAEIAAGGEGFSNEEVKAMFAARRITALSQGAPVIAPEPDR